MKNHACLISCLSTINLYIECKTYQNILLISLSKFVTFFGVKFKGKRIIDEKWQCEFGGGASKVSVWE